MTNPNMPTPNQDPEANKPIIKIEVVDQESRDAYQNRGETSLESVRAEKEARAAAAARRAELFNTDYTKFNATERAEFLAKIKQERETLNRYINEDRARLGLDALATEVNAKASAENDTDAGGKASAEADTSGLDVIVADESVTDEPITTEEADTTETVDQAAETIPIVPNITPEEAGEIKTISTAAAEASYEKASPKAGGVKEFFKKNLPYIIMGAIGAVAIAGGLTFHAVNAQQSASQDEEQPPATEQTDGNYSSYDAYHADTGKSTGETQEAHHGIESLNQLINGSFEQDGNIGCYENNNKVDQASVGNPRAVADYLGIDFDNATPEERGIISEYINKSMKYPAAATLINHGHPDFAGLSQIEAENKIAHATDQEKQGYQDWLQNEFNHSTYHIEEGKGTMVNHGVIEGTDGRHSTYSETDLTGVKILVRTTVQEDGTTVVDYEKDDCANWLYTVVTHSDGSVVVIVPPPSPDTPVNPPTPDNPTPTPEPTPTPTPPDDSKNAAAIEKNMQTGNETSNRVAPRGPGEVTSRPDTSQDSYQAEQDYQRQTVEDARNQESGSANGGTVGDIIEGADQTYSEHQTYTSEQRATQQQEQQAQVAQDQASQNEITESNANMSDAEAAEWLNSLQR